MTRPGVGSDRRSSLGVHFLPKLPRTDFPGGTGSFWYVSILTQGIISLWICSQSWHCQCCTKLLLQEVVLLSCMIALGLHSFWEEYPLSLLWTFFQFFPPLCFPGHQSFFLWFLTTVCIFSLNGSVEIFSRKKKLKPSNCLTSSFLKIFCFLTKCPDALVQS